MSSSSSSNEMHAVKNLDLNKFLGRWFEIASIPTALHPEKGTCTRDKYDLDVDGTTLHVLNETWIDGKMEFTEGKAFKVDISDDEAKFKIEYYDSSFLPNLPVSEDYWILDVDSDRYQFALIGQPSREYLLILCKQEHLDEAIYKQLVEKAKSEGFDVTKLHVIEQRCCCPNCGQTPCA